MNKFPMFKKKWFQNILAILIVVAISIPIFLSQRYDAKKLHENGKETVGTIVGFGRRSSVIWEYTLNGQVYKIHERGKYVDGLERGERYMALINPESTKVGIMYFHRPYFGNEPIDTAKVSSFPHGKPKDENVISIYKYSVLGIEYERRQRIPYGNSRHEFVSSDSFFVVYYMNRPEIGYLFPVLGSE